MRRSAAQLAAVLALTAALGVLGLAGMRTATHAATPSRDQAVARAAATGATARALAAYRRDQLRLVGATDAAPVNAALAADRRAVADALRAARPLMAGAADRRRFSGAVRRWAVYRKATARVSALSAAGEHAAATQLLDAAAPGFTALEAELGA